MSKISVALAAFNGAKYLEQQLLSFAEQVRLPDEVVITDDGSVDCTPEIVSRFARTAPFEVRYYRNETRLGYGQNFCRALSLTNGDLVFLSDQDDVWFPNKISMVESRFTSERVLLVMNDAELANSELNPAGVTKQGQIRSAGLNEQHFVMGCCACIRSDLLRLLLPMPRSHRAHDSWLVQFAIGLDAREVLPDVLQYYRRHGNNESDFFVNSVKPITRWTSIKKRWLDVNHLNAGSEELERRLDETKSVLDRLVRHRKDFADIANPEAVNAFQRSLDTRLEVLGKRIALRDKPRGTDRFKAAAQLWREGGYAEASGFQSLLKDLLIRRA